MAEGRYRPKGITLEELEKQMADLRAEVHRLSPEGTDKKQQASGGGHSEKTDLLAAVSDHFHEMGLRAADRE
jgi:hypothetical protein